MSLLCCLVSKIRWNKFSKVYQSSTMRFTYQFESKQKFAYISRMWSFGILVIFCLAATTCADPSDPMSQEFIDIVNRKAKTWRAGQNFPNQTSFSYLRGLMGVRSDPDNFRLPMRSLQNEDENSEELPETFDSREQWPNCPTIKKMYPQGNCGSCWAVATATAISDRHCIHGNVKGNFPLSVQDLLTCCRSCGYGCNGGFPDMAWIHWVMHGLVSGGPYGSRLGCQPYTIAPYESEKAETPKCVWTCQRAYKKSYWTDKQVGLSAYSVQNDERSIQLEIFRNGPVVTSFTVYEDMYSYKDGVYQHVHGKKVTKHAVRLIGWGTENDTPYWLIANSWIRAWGDGGFGKILRGKNHCGIEESITAGIPKYTVEDALQ